MPGNLVAAVESTCKPERPIRSENISVCHIASGDRWAGAEAQLAMLLKGLAQKGKFLLSAILLNEGQLAEEGRRYGVDVKVISESEKNFGEIFAEASWYLRGKDVRILHSHRYKENLLAALLAWHCKVPFVVRSQQGLAEPYEGLKRHKQALLHLADRIVARYATDRLICASDDLRNEFLRHVEPQNVVTIHNAVDREQACSSLSLPDAKKRLGLPEDCCVVGTAGRLEPIKRCAGTILLAH